MRFTFQESAREFAASQRHRTRLTARLEESLYWLMSATIIATLGMMCLRELTAQQKSLISAARAQEASLTSQPLWTAKIPTDSEMFPSILRNRGTTSVRN